MSKTNASHLSKLSTGLAIGVTCGLYMLFSGWVSVTGWCANIVQNLSSAYIGFEPGFVGGIIGAIWGFVDGFISGFLIAYFYNYFHKKTKK